MEKSAKYYGPVGRRWIPQWYRKTLGNYPGIEMSLQIEEFRKLLTMDFLFTSVTLYPSGVFDGVEE